MQKQDILSMLHGEIRNMEQEEKKKFKSTKNITKLEKEAEPVAGFGRQLEKKEERMKMEKKLKMQDELEKKEEMMMTEELKNKEEKLKKQKKIVNKLQGMKKKIVETRKKAAGWQHPGELKLEAKLEYLDQQLNQMLAELGITSSFELRTPLM